MHNYKYMGRKYSGWKVVYCEITPDGRHTRYTLVKKLFGFKRTITLRENALRQIELGNKSIKNYLKGKQFELTKNVNIPFNTVYKEFKLFGL